MRSNGLLSAGGVYAMWAKAGQVAEEILHKTTYETLIRAAQSEQITTYSEIAPLANLDMENPDDREEIGRILGAISTYEYQHGRPMLSAIVVHRQDNIPGEGFFELARELGLLKSGQDRLAFWCREVARVHEAWTHTVRAKNPRQEGAPGRNDLGG